MKRPLRNRNLGGAPRRLLGGYGPLLALAVTFLLVVTLVPTIARQTTVMAAQSDDAGSAAAGATVAGATPGAALGAGPVAKGKKAALPGPAGAVAAAGPCADRTVQVVGDPYSPPCIAWPTGKENGGATSPGVTKDTIRISFRMPIENISDYESVIRQLTGDKGDAIPTPTEADVRRTIQDYITYFERNFQTYGRKIDLVEWKGKGSVLNEIVGAGQEAAQADAIRAAKELKVFADVSAFTQPYSDALARQGVVAIGAPYMSQQWFAAHQPYAWSPFPDCTSLTETIAEYLNKRVFGHPADHAGPGVVGKQRKVALVVPDNPEYQQCADAGEKIIEAAGNKAARYNYTLDLATLSDQANNLAAKLKQDGVTTIVLATDPLLPLLLTSRMSQQDYYPEWVVTGTALTDLDVVGQFYDQSQWKHAFGMSMLGEQQPQGASYAYAAAKSVDPNHEPIFGSELIYYFMYMIATGIQMAGPDLTPQTFAAGMHAYPGGTGPAGTWAYPKGDYSPYRDAREIWWDPNGNSVFNNAPGRYASTNKRYKPGAWPTGPAAPQQLAPAPKDVATKPEDAR
ncbi:MAG TPA: hypothetical protein VGJ14_18475 [Sporichthyaceae bacterium]|jgi:hypothetical protein